MSDKNSLTEKEYWNSFYSGWRIAIPSQFCTMVATELPSSATIVEFGCGNGRDSVYFAEQGFWVYAMDLSKEAIKQDIQERSLGQGKHLYFTQGDAASASDVSGIIKTAREKDSGKQSITIYSRFFLHTLDESQEQKFLKLLSENLVSGDQVYLEFRCDQDRNKKKTFGGHFRRYIETESLVRQLPHWLTSMKLDDFRML